jgi:hypothetical protein
MESGTRNELGVRRGIRQSAGGALDQRFQVGDGRFEMSILSQIASIGEDADFDVGYKPPQPSTNPLRSGPF